ncbi:dynein regulatory complex subunit 2-like [Antennarius striatus]|uniref:dynein regulatory complex subunit 2-like n=1 Tax=Antennarius striatus TaxID=241820 RepID=UPI0035B38C16
MPKKAKPGGGKGGSGGRGGRGGKGGGRTEERLMSLHRSAQAAEENAKKREEVFTLFLKDKLQREERNTAVNLLKLDDGWRSVLRQSRAAELRDDVTVARQTFERQVDHLDSVLQSLKLDLQEADRRSDHIRRLHLQNLERLLTQHNQQVTSIQQHFENVLQNLTTKSSSERDQMWTNAEQRRARLEDAAFMLKQRRQAEMTETHRLYRDIITAQECDTSDMVAKLSQVDKEQLMEKKELEMIYNEELKVFNERSAKNQQAAQELDVFTERLKRLQDFVKKLRELKNSNIVETQLEEQDMTEHQSQVKQKTQQVREQLRQNKKTTRQQLTDLVVQSNKAKKKLQATLDKGERILRRIEICNKLERKCGLLVSTEEQRPESTGPEPQPDAPDFPALQPLMRRLNTALLKGEALKKHKDELRRENKQLKLLLRQHLDAMTVNDNTLDGPGALLGVNPAPVIVVTPTDTNRRYTVIEAVHAIAHSL